MLYFIRWKQHSIHDLHFKCQLCMFHYRGVAEITIAAESGAMVEAKKKHEDEDTDRSNSSATVGIFLGITIIGLAIFLSFVLFKTAMRNPTLLIKTGLYGIHSSSQDMHIYIQLSLRYNKCHTLTSFITIILWII